jgi:hypothetical protein
MPYEVLVADGDASEPAGIWGLLMSFTMAADPVSGSAPPGITGQAAQVRRDLKVLPSLCDLTGCEGRHG